MKDPSRNKARTFFFNDYPQFNPNIAPWEIFQEGGFGGTYWRPIHSNVTQKNYKDAHLEFPKFWWKGLDPNTHLVSSICNKSVNKYKVTSGTSLSYWEEKGWIEAQDPYGWVQWYCRFFQGRRSPDDERQISRWVRTAGPKSRFRVRLKNMLINDKKKYDDISVSPKIRQLLLQWGYQLTSKDFETYKKYKTKQV